MAETISQVIPTQTRIKIPQQLIDAGAKFNKVAPNLKSAIEKDWQINTYTHDSNELIRWINGGGNYGVVSHGIGTIDIDHLDMFKSLGLEIPDSYTDCREGCRYHVYFKCAFIPQKRNSTKFTPTPKWGDIRFPGHNSYVVGTGCIAPNDKNELHKYEHFNDSPVRFIDWSVLQTIIDKSSDQTVDDGTLEVVETKPNEHFEPLSIKDKMHHHDLRRYVGNQVYIGVPLVAIHAATAEMNKQGLFDRVRGDRELTVEVDGAWGWHSRKKAERDLGRSKNPKPANSHKNDEKTPEYIHQQRGWFEYKNVMYMEVFDIVDEVPVYSYAYSDNGTIKTVDEILVREADKDGDKILVSGLKYVPRHLPKNQDGQAIPMVCMASKANIDKISTVNISELKDAMVSHVRKYCDLGVNDMNLCVYYVLMTWFYPKLSTLPYLRFRADTGKGKSRILKVISDMCFMAVKAGGASTAAGTIRFQEYWHGSLVIDEADIKGESSDGTGYTNDMIKYLNLGFEKGQYFIKSDKQDPKQQEVFDPFCPKIIAMRGIFQDPATEGRCLSISPSETERTDISAILPTSYDGEIEKIRAMLTHFTLTNWGLITNSDPYPDFQDVECEPRLKQLGSPLARVLSKILPGGMALFKHYIEHRQIEVKIDRSQSFAGNLVNLVYDAALEQESTFGPDAYVTIKSIADAVGSSSNKVSRALNDSGLVTEQRRISIPTTDENGFKKVGKTINQKVIAVPNGKVWREIVRRYIVVEKDQSTLVGDNSIITLPTCIKSKEYVN